MKMKINDQPDLLTLHLSGSFDELSADWFDLLSDRLKRVPVNVLVNFSQVTYIDSKGLGAIFSLHKCVEFCDHHMFFCQLSQSTTEVFELAGLQHILRIYATEKEALKAIALCQ